MTLSSAPQKKLLRLVNRQMNGEWGMRVGMRMLISNFQRAAFVKLRGTHRHTQTNRIGVENNNKRKTKREVEKTRK